MPTSQMLFAGWEALLKILDSERVRLFGGGFYRY